MKRIDLLRFLADEGCVLVRTRGGHDVYRNVITGKMEAVPRHVELKEMTARSILRRLAAPLAGADQPAPSVLASPH